MAFQREGTLIVWCKTRQDIGALWENFCVLERLKYLHNQGIHPNIYFWRTHDQQEVDYLEERNNILTGFEFKWRGPKTFHPPKLFLETYPNSTVNLVTKLSWPLLITLGDKNRYSSQFK